MRRVDVFLVADKRATDEGTADLVRLRRAILDRYLPDGGYRLVEVVDPKRDRRPDDYHRELRGWHSARALAYAGVLRREVAADGTAGFLVWGDPALYDSTIRVVDQMTATGMDLDVQVVPGISAVQLLAARHRLVLNRIGEPVTVSTGRLLAQTVEQG